MKALRSLAHIVNTKQLKKEVFRNTLNLSMKVKSFHVHIVHIKQLRKEALRDTLNQYTNAKNHNETQNQ